MIKVAVQYALAAYKRWISPMLPASCRYVPSCSEYAMEAVERHGALYGGALGVWRILRCHPFVKGGYDPVPLHGPKFFPSSCRHEHKLTTGN
jgi:hypothetical protein